MEKFQKDNEKYSKDIPLLKEVVDGAWRKEPELAALKAEFTELDRKIQLSLKPISDSEGQPLNEPEKAQKQVPEDNRHKPQDGNRQPYISARLREVMDSSGGRIVVGSIPRHNTNDSDNPPKSSIKI